ncbi:hypothetical protein ACHHYP_06009 [Achlya hypogyna]|uniref:Transmembrane protein n=1 Tax=Achlya hypogyna TaxID=1202772 RepID=A0A1V9ZND1_ACHHY|nr:hypothetical protein ACHHYP_06009 [Achlya hypogyna]
MLRTFRSRPTLSANQHGDYEEKVAQWFELFLDLLFVGACASVAASLEEDLTWAGVGDFVFNFTQYMAGWLLYTNFVSRFDEPSFYHCGFLFVLLGGFGGIVLGGSPGVAFTTGLLLVRVSIMAMYVNIYVRLPETRQQVWLDLLLLLCAIIALSVALSVEHPRIWYGAVLAIEIPLRGVWMVKQWLFSNGIRIYVNIDHANERATNLVLVALGEAVLAATQNYADAKVVTPRFSLCMLLSLLLSFGMAMFYNTTQPPRHFHALKRSAWTAFFFYMVHFVLWPSLVALGVGTQFIKHTVLHSGHLNKDEVWVLLGSLALGMLCVLWLRVLHYGGRQPTAGTLLVCGA